MLVANSVAPNGFANGAGGRIVPSRPDHVLDVGAAGRARPWYAGAFLP